MNATHQRAHQPLDMATEPRRRRGTIFDLNPMLLAPALERTGVEFAAVIDVDDLRQPVHRPREIDIALL